MKTLSFSHGMLLAVTYAATTQGSCSSDLLVDDYSHYLNHTNCLGRYTSDDGSVKDLTVDVVNKKIHFNATKGSYFYTNFDCETATGLGYTAVTFPIKSDCGGSFELELQTSTDCTTISSAAYAYFVPTKMIGEFITVTLPLSSFAGANPNAIRSLVFGGFTLGIWEIGMTQLVCVNSKSYSVNSSTGPSSHASCITSTSSSSLNLATVANVTMAFISTFMTPLLTASSHSSSLKSTPATSTSQLSLSSSKMTTTSPPAQSCASIIVDDFALPFRLLSQHLNALLQPSYDNGTMKEVTVANSHVTLVPRDSKSYFYTSFGCLNVTNIYDGIKITLSTKVHTVITFRIRTTKTCDAENFVDTDITSEQLGWKFDGTEQYYNIQLTSFPELDISHIRSLELSGTRNTFTLGSVEFYCKNTRAYAT